VAVPVAEAVRPQVARPLLLAVPGRGRGAAV